ncbi:MULTISPECIES: 7-cyano-7-deazaguanine synthase [unclassified Caulobacter]|uniref:7-cyano-7-deazaguanine synthase n=1 Tax=unclassified Caulobacter TaxID=2648921 RepID=UPI00082C8BD0|nr:MULTISPECIES: 7-cyano-7-deazaguanine synthase [unclassified Caulobacter]MBQ1562844.1 7-cyano-7-deazaguanine synthase [Caulobacter sp.]PIB96234.1 ATPase [Caulobacter sp. X]
MTALAIRLVDETMFVDVVDEGVRVRDEAELAALGDAIRLSTEGLETYFFSKWRPELFDLLVVAAAAEYCDAAKARSTVSWSRTFDVRVAVHDVQLWSSTAVKSALEGALTFLTGDTWTFSFVARRQSAQGIRQASLELPAEAKAIMPYSDGLDSRAVHAITAQAVGRADLVRVRLGSVGVDDPQRERRRAAFTLVPYKVQVPQRKESSARSRGFKFAVVTGVAAQIAGVDRIIVTESGQGSFGPMMAVSGQIYPDYRVHPLFTTRVERLFEALVGSTAHYEYPRLWSTKGETLAEAAALPHPPSWSDTRSCWQQSRHASIDGRRRQCGICAACMLRRMSMFAAGLAEPAGAYIWENLSASTFEAGAVEGFIGITDSMREHAIAGILHMDHMADLAIAPSAVRAVRRVARETAEVLNQDPVEIEGRLRSLLTRHAAEWRRFLDSLAPESFVRDLSVVPA